MRVVRPSKEAAPEQGVWGPMWREERDQGPDKGRDPVCVRGGEWLGLDDRQMALGVRVGRDPRLTGWGSGLTW